MDATQGDAVAILCTTSGTTSHPKLAMLSAVRLLRHCAVDDFAGYVITREPQAIIVRPIAFYG